MDLRKEKAALIKLAVLEETHKLIGKKPSENLNVLEICKRVGSTVKIPLLPDYLLTCTITIIINYCIVGRIVCISLTIYEYQILCF